MVTIVLALNPGAPKACEEELKAAGFKKKEVWTKYVGQDKDKADGEVFRMKNIPAMFLTSSWWGMGVD